MNPRKELSIKVEIEKLLKDGFIYLVPLTEWISNPVPVDKKQGTIWVCTKFRDLDNSCPKDSLPTPFINHILDQCDESKVLSFMVGLSMG